MLSNELLSALAFALILYVLSRDVGTAGCQGTSAPLVQFFAFFFYIA
mgnify:CR=1 FL=1